MSKYNPLIYGKNDTEKLVSIEVKDDMLYLFFADGSIKTEPYKYWFLTNQAGKSSKRLGGSQYYRFINEFNTLDEYKESKTKAKRFKVDLMNVFNLSEQTMLRQGYTLFKDMKVDEISVLSFDIESNGLLDNETHRPLVGRDKAEIYIISNAFRDSSGNIERKLFSLDQYDNSGEMLKDWSRWVVEKNPTVLCGHNIFSYDIPYMNYMYRSYYNTNLPIGWEGEEMQVDNYTRQFRKDGSMSFSYYEAHAFGRQIVDTMFLSIKYDNVAKKYNSYGLKSIIADEGLEKEDRTFYDASKIAKNWNDLEQRELIKKYADEDADDALKLYDLMIPSTFYLTQSLPMTLQHVVNTATGRQVNSLMIRSYLQKGYSIASASAVDHFQGAISFGIPGIYSNCFKLDFSSLYPSIMLQYNIHSKAKDPDNNFIQIVKYFTEERLKNKSLSKKTKDRYYDDLQSAQKIVINSAYGFMGANGLNYNHVSGAAEVTRYGREILEFSSQYFTSKSLEHWKSKIGE